MFKVVIEAFTFSTKEAASAASDFLTDALMDFDGADGIAAVARIVEVDPETGEAIATDTGAKGPIADQRPGAR